MLVHLRRATVAVGVLACAAFAAAQQRPAPVVDMHLHASAADANGPPPLGLCTPLGDMLRDAKNDWSAGFLAIQKKPPCSDPVWSPATDAGVMNETIEVLKRRNIIGVVSGTTDRVQRWREQAPDRVIPGLGFQLRPKAPSCPSHRSERSCITTPRGSYASAMPRSRSTADSHGS
jgi:hypothetical protein